MTEEKVLGVLAEKPLKLHALLKRVSSSGSNEELQVLLMRMRDAGKVKFKHTIGDVEREPLSTTAVPGHIELSSPGLSR